MAGEMAPEVQPGMSEGVPPGAAPVEGGSEGQQLRDLVGGIQEGMGMIRTMIEAAPEAPEEAKAFMDAANDSFMQAMQLMINLGDDEAAAEPEMPIAPEAALNERPQFVPKGPGSL